MTCTPVRIFSSIIAVLGLSFALGCADVITYSRESREQGIASYKQGDYADAAGAFRNAIRQQPADYTSHYYLANCLEQMRSYEQAIQQYKTCLQVMSNSLEGKTDIVIREETLDGLARSVAKSADPSTEIAALSSTPHTAENLFVLAKINRNIGDADAAIDAYRAASLLDPKDFNIAKEYGLYLEQLGMHDQARAELRRANGLNQGDQEVQVSLREAGGIPGPSNKAEADLEKPPVPQGPLPEVDVTKLRLQNPFRSAPDQNTATSSGSAEAAPRD